MTLLRLLAPVLVDHARVPGVWLRDPDGYAAFWGQQQERTDRASRVRAAAEGVEQPRFVFEHVRPARSLNLYRRIDDTGTDRAPHVLSGELAAAHLPRTFPGGASPVGQVLEVSFRLHDHGILLVEAMLEVGPWLAARTGSLEDRLDELQDAAVSLGESLARECVTQWVDPLLARVRAADRRHEVLEAPAAADEPGTADLGDALWVTRSLVLAPDHPDTAAAVRHWTKDVGRAQGEADPAQDLLEGRADHHARWLNYVFLDRDGAGAAVLPDGRFRDEWSGLRYAQFFYGALDRIDSRLARVLADSAAATAHWEVAGLKEQLVALSQRAELVLMDRQDLAKYLKRSVRRELDALLDVWDHELLLERPVRFKIETCDRRLAELSARRTARSAMFTDIILLGIGVTSILATALALTDFGRGLRANPSSASYDLGASAVTQWLASQPADAILAASATVSLLLVVLYLVFRRDHGS